MASTTIGNYEVVLFDLDGTLVDSLDSFTVSATRALQEFGMNVPEEQLLKSFVKEPLSTAIFKIYPGIAQRRAAQIVERYIQIYDNGGYKLVRTMDNSEMLLKRLKASGKKVGIVTARQLLFNSLEPTLAFLGLQRYIDVMVTARDVSKPKPEPLQHELAIRRLGVNADTVLAVGDSPEDVLAAKAAGIDVAAYTGGFFPKAALSACGPRYLVDTLGQVLEIVL